MNNDNEDLKSNFVNTDSLLQEDLSKVTINPLPVDNSDNINPPDAAFLKEFEQYYLNMFDPNMNAIIIHRFTTSKTLVFEVKITKILITFTQYKAGKKKQFKYTFNTGQLTINSQPAPQKLSLFYNMMTSLSKDVAEHKVEVYVT